MADNDGFVLVGGPKKQKRGFGDAEVRRKNVRERIPDEVWQKMSKKERAMSWKMPRNVARSTAPVVRPIVKTGGVGSNAVKAMNVFASSKSSYAGAVRGTTVSEGLEKAKPLFVEEFKHEWTSSLSDSTFKFLTSIREDKARRESRRAWRVQLKCEVLPNIPENVWTKMMRKAALCIEEECFVVETRPHTNGVELCLSRPVIIDVGSKVGKFEVVLSEPIDESMCVSMWEWTSNEAAAGELTKEVVNNLCGETIMLQMLTKRRMMTVSIGPMIPFVGHNALVLEGFPLANRMPVFEKACRACHGLKHRAADCVEYWNNVQIPEWSKGQIYKQEKEEKAAKEPEKEEVDKKDAKTSSTDEEDNKKLNESATSALVDTAVEQAKLEAAMKDVRQLLEETSEVNNEAALGVPEIENATRMDAELETRHETAMDVEEATQDEIPAERMQALVEQTEMAVRTLKTKAHVGMKDEEIEELIPRMMEAARVTGQMLTSPAQADAQYWRDMFKRQRLVKEIRAAVFKFPSMFWMVECGGQGNCGLWAMLCGGILLGLFERPETNVMLWTTKWIAEMRKLVDERLTEGDVTTKEGRARIKAAKEELAERRRKQNMWFDTTDLQTLASILGMNVMIMEHAPASRRGGIAEAICGDPSKEAIIIFGGTHFKGGHWVLLTNAKRARIDAIWKHVLIQGTLEAYWKKIDYNWSETPEVVQQVSVVDEIDLRTSGETAAMSE